MTNQDIAEQKAQYLRAVFDAIPLPAFIVDSDVRIQDFNIAAERFLGPEPAAGLWRRGGEAFRCIHSEENGCGHSAPCGDCVIRNSVSEAMKGRSTCRAIHQAEVRTQSGTARVELLVTVNLLPYTDSPQALLILEDVSEILRLHKPKARGPRKAGRKPI